jgi:hypothetical protein
MNSAQSPLRRRPGSGGNPDGRTRDRDTTGYQGQRDATSGAQTEDPVTVAGATMNMSRRTTRRTVH